MTETIARVVFFFFVYSIIGWGVEVAYAAVTTRQLVNRGFLNGPICPIYGCGMTVLMGAVRLLTPDGPQQELAWPAVFLLGMTAATLIELAGGWILYRLFHTRWWDYSNYKWNLGGYICPQFSLLWGLGSVVMVKLVHPALTGLARPLPLVPLLVIDGVALLIFGVDLGLSIAAAVGLNRQLEEIDEMRAALRRTSDRLTDIIGTSAMNADTLLDEQKLQMTLAAMEGRDNAAELRAQAEELLGRAGELRARLEALNRGHSGPARLLRAFPDMKSARHSESLAVLRRRALDAAATARQKAQTAADRLHR